MRGPGAPLAADDRRVAAITAGAVIDLGCGSRKRHPDWIGIDALDFPGVDIIGDATVALSGMADGSVAGVFSSHFFEHVTDVAALMREVTRVVAPGGRIEIVVPHFSNAYFYSDPTHRTAFGLYSMAYFVEETPFRREVPVYGDALPLELTDVTLRFKASPPFYVRYVARRAVQWMVNRSRWAQEFYEDNLTWIIPCYELRFELRRALTGDAPSAGAPTG